MNGSKMMLEKQMAKITFELNNTAPGPKKNMLYKEALNLLILSRKQSFSDRVPKLKIASKPSRRSGKMNGRTNKV